MVNRLASRQSCRSVPMSWSLDVFCSRGSPFFRFALRWHVRKFGFCCEALFLVLGHVARVLKDSSFEGFRLVNSLIVCHVEIVAAV